MDTTTQNIVAALLMLLVHGAFIAAALKKTKRNSGDIGFSAFWCGWAGVLLGVYTRSWSDSDYYLPLAFDAFGNACLFAAAYCLFRSDRYRIDSNTWTIVIVGVLTAVTIGVVGHVIAQKGIAVTPMVRACLVAPGQLLGCVAFVAIGIYGGQRFPEHRSALYSICFAYAALQFPAYFAGFVEEPPPIAPTTPPATPSAFTQLAPTAIEVLRQILAVGKCLLLGGFLLIVFRSRNLIKEYQKLVNGITVAGAIAKPLYQVIVFLSAK